MSLARSRFLAVLLAALLALSFAACGEDNKQPPEDAPIPTEDGGITYADPEYYPIVAQPITFEIAYHHFESSEPRALERVLWAEIQNLTGITLDIRSITSDGETTKLFYAARDYPDISFRMPNVTTLTQAAALSGDILEITDEILDKYMPAWKVAFNDYPELYRMSTYTDGKLYTLPNFYSADEGIYLRDAWMINGDWLDELGMAMPETLDQFTDYLRAVKQGAGTGSIPSNAVPLFVRHMYNIGSWFNIADAFGLYNGLSDEIVENGIVKSNALNPLLKDVVKYMAQLYKEGLINQDFTTNWDIYTSATDYNNDQTTPWYIGSYFGYSNNGKEFIQYMAPPLTNSGFAPTIRPTSIYTRCYIDAFMVFTNCKYPAAAFRFANYFGSLEGGLRAYYGEKGVFWDINEKGEFYRIDRTGKEDETLLYKGLVTRVPAFVPSWVTDQLDSENIKDISTRVGAYEQIYKNYVPKGLDSYPTPALKLLTQEEFDLVTKMENDIFNLCKNQINKWVKGTSSVDSDWDAFQNKLADLGIHRLLELQQKAYNLYMSFSY